VTLGRAKSVLSGIWIVMFAALFAIVGLQTIFGKFGDDWDTGFGWIFPLTVPAVALMATVWTVTQTNQDRTQITATAVLWGAMLFSVLYLLAMLAVLLLSPFTDLPLPTQLHRSAWWLGVLQGIVMALLGRLFIVNAA